MGKLVLCFVFIIVFAQNTLYAQNTRLNNCNSIGWYNYLGTFKLAEKFGVHTEYQFRRNEFIMELQ